MECRKSANNIFFALAASRATRILFELSTFKTISESPEDGC